MAFFSYLKTRNSWLPIGIDFCRLLEFVPSWESSLARSDLAAYSAFSTEEFHCSHVKLFALNSISDCWLLQNNALAYVVSSPAGSLCRPMYKRCIIQGNNITACPNLMSISLALLWALYNLSVAFFLCQGANPSQSYSAFRASLVEYLDNLLLRGNSHLLVLADSFLAASKP